MRPIYFMGVWLLACALGFAGCGSYDEEARRYEVEQAYFLADKTAKDYSVKPELRTPQDYLRLVDVYVKVYDIFKRNFPNADARDTTSKASAEASFLAGRSLLAASALLLSAEAIDSARSIFDLLLTSPAIQPRHRHDALYAAGKLAERDDRWAAAESLYNTLLQEAYPPLERGYYPIETVIELPKYITEHYVQLPDSVTARDRARRAIAYYKGIVDSFPKIPMTMMATRLLAEMYESVGDYRAAVATLETVVDSTGRIFDPAKAMIADLYLTQLNRPQDAVRMYNEIITGGIDSNTIAVAHLKLATLAFADGRYQEGRNYLDRLKERFRTVSGLQAQAQLARARSFEEEGNNERARQEYVALLNEYPLTAQALDVLVYLPDYFERIGQPRFQQEWTERAEQELRKIVDSQKNNQLGLQASSYLGTFLIRQKRFHDAIVQLETLRQDFPNTQEAATALMKIAVTYDKDLNDKARALETYREFLKQYPQSRVRSTVENEIRKLEQTP